MRIFSRTHRYCTSKKDTSICGTSLPRLEHDAALHSHVLKHNLNDKGDANSMTSSTCMSKPKLSFAHIPDFIPSPTNYIARPNMKMPRRLCIPEMSLSPIPTTSEWTLFLSGLLPSFKLCSQVRIGQEILNKRFPGQVIDLV